MHHKTCPSCNRKSLRNIKGTNHLACEACNTTVFHEGNGYIEETF